MPRAYILTSSSPASTTSATSNDVLVWTRDVTPAWTTNVTSASVTATNPVITNAILRGSSWAARYEQQRARYEQHWVRPLLGSALPETSEARAAREAMLARFETAEAARMARIEAARKEHTRANERAERLLFEHLTQAQQEELRLRGRFHLETIAANGERRRYCIRRGRHGNIDQVDASGRVIKRLCVHPTLNVPDADTMLAQKLFLECAEEQLLRVANQFPE